jgi:hypothetical protein
MAVRKRYYHIDGPEAGLTPSQLKRSSRATKRDYMVAWFTTYYEDPANQTPYNGREGGYQYIHGGPYNAHEELFEEFGNLADEALIAEAAEEVENEDGILDWAPSSQHQDMRDAADEAMLDRDDDPDDYVPGDGVRPSLDERLASIERAIRSGTKPSFGLPEERAFRADVLDRIAGLEAELAKLKPAHGRMGHNGPPGEIETPTDLIREVKEATTQIKEELAKPEPEAGNVLTATKALTAVLGWVGSKLNNFVDAAVKSAGDATGKLLAPFLMVGAVGLWGSITSLISTIAEKAAGWLELVTFFPF